jgi:xanthosine utilization system XapX-like protein
MRVMLVYLGVGIVGLVYALWRAISPEPPEPLMMLLLGVLSGLLIGVSTATAWWWHEAGW